MLGYGDCFNERGGENSGAWRGVVMIFVFQMRGGGCEGVSVVLRMLLGVVRAGFEDFFGTLPMFGWLWP